MLSDLRQCGRMFKSLKKFLLKKVASSPFLAYLAKQQESGSSAVLGGNVKRWPKHDSRDKNKEGKKNTKKENTSFPMDAVFNCVQFSYVSILPNSNTSTCLQ